MVNIYSVIVLAMGLVRSLRARERETEPLISLIKEKSECSSHPIRGNNCYKVGGDMDSTEICVCVCVFSSHSFWTSSSLDVPAGVTQEEGHTGFLIHLLSAVRALIFLARSIQPFLSLGDREVDFCVLTN